MIAIILRTLDKCCKKWILFLGKNLFMIIFLRGIQGIFSQENGTPEENLRGVIGLNEVESSLKESNPKEELHECDEEEEEEDRFRRPVCRNDLPECRVSL
ncbi:Hypothetical predicted protein [Olea europaea subsp. europaea]|uniref:Uncharacterized protein n=1 Tax=Olea europaea subsp. europaea TaxID=158383 RepID=A0A8S0S8R5_OLEEU|nr:Hypothetical predicted protein [Olea europaea subsp. europaea]